MAEIITENRRQDATSRAVARDERVSIKKRREASAIDGKLKDYGKGGIGIEIKQAVINLIAVCDEVIVSYVLCGVKVKDRFFVRSVNHINMRVGLQYADGKKFNPQQRIMASHEA